ncbi:MAG TPA: NYN domain-containing protein [Candidatus Limnocylindrales bacterium]
MSKNVAVFVDVANIFYAAKAAGVDIDYVTLLKASSAGRDLVRAYAYTGLDPENENQRNFHDFLRRHGYKVVSKDIRKYGDGKVKANLDIELVVDMLKTARNLDIAIVVSGDGDFAPAIRAVQEMGVRVEVVSFRGNTSSDLIDVADIFTDITQIAKVEKGSSRSGRRVADDDEDLSMTEVPEKQSEGTGESRRGRGRGRTRTGEAARETSRDAREGGRTRRSAAATNGTDAGEGALVALPGEKLSRARTGSAAAAAAAGAASDLDEADVDAEGMTAEEAAENGQAGESDEAGRRRRRRRGGRGRGRGRREEGLVEAGAPRAASDADESDEADEADEEEFEQPAPPARKVASTFGSVWDSQIGVPAASGRQAASPSSTPFDDEEDLDEPPIPEYLIAERRQQNAGARGGRGGRGGRGSAYAAAMERERFGGGRGAQVSRFAEPAPRRDSGPNRFDRNDRRDRGFRDSRPEARPAPRGTSEEPWSEVPPELEAMLRAQLASGGGRAAARPAPRAEAAPAATAETAEPAVEAPAPKARRGRTSAKAAAAEAAPPAETGTAAEPAAAKRRTTRAKAAVPAVEAGVAEAAASDADAGAAAPKRTVRRRSAKVSTADAAKAGDEPAAAPKRRTTRSKAADSAS